jgi:hypothetical protein
MDQLEEYRRQQEQKHKRTSQTPAPPQHPPPQPARPAQPQQPPQRPPQYQPQPPTNPADQRWAPPPPSQQHGVESDEEYARRLQAQLYADEQQQVRPPMNVQRQERLVEPHYSYPQQSRQPLLGQAPPPPSNSHASFWPEVSDKCFGLSTQKVVLGTAVGMVVVIIVVLIVLSV